MKKVMTWEGHFVCIEGIHTLLRNIAQENKTKAMIKGGKLPKSGQSLIHLGRRAQATLTTIVAVQRNAPNVKS